MIPAMMDAIRQQSGDREYSAIMLLRLRKHRFCGEQTILQAQAISMLRIYDFVCFLRWRYPEAIEEFFDCRVVFAGAFFYHPDSIFRGEKIA